MDKTVSESGGAAGGLHSAQLHLLPHVLELWHLRQALGKARLTEVKPIELLIRSRETRS